MGSESEWWAAPQKASTDTSAVSAFQTRPVQVTWEMTRICEWKAAPVRAAARIAREPRQFSTAEAFHLIEQVQKMHVPLLTLTGGDPLLRPDLFPIIEFASQRSVRTSLTLLPTPMLENSVLTDLKACGLMRVGLWLHGSTATLHDDFWGIAGSHRRTTEIIGRCHEVQLPVQINTIIARRNLHDLEPMVDFLTHLDIALWNVIFFVPSGPEQAPEMLDAEAHERTFAKLYEASQRVHFQIKTTEAQHYQRYLLQHRAGNSRKRLTEADVITCAPRGLNDGKGFVFINHQGEAYPSRYLPLSGGNVTHQSLSQLFSDSQLFVSLRDSSNLKGKCGRCPARNVCGGSRARAYAMTGDLFAADPCCAYEP
jgi:AdoMet-dependent heme synthase